MKTLFKPLFLILIFSIVSCKNEFEKPKVSYIQKTKKTVKAIDTAKIILADLPIQFEGTKYLIFPIGSLNGNESNARYESSNGNGNLVFSVSNNMDNEITGYLTNLRFQKIGSDSLISLTDKSIFLESTTYLKTIADKTKNQILVHQLADNDSNNDDKLDSNDIKSVYLSTVSGEGFTKITPDFEEIITWKIIETQNRLYLKTIKDSNKNGQFDIKDSISYHYINLIEKKWKSIQYRPF